MNGTQNDGAGKPAVFSPISGPQIEEVNLRRILAISIGVLALEVINLFNPNFWSTPILWIGAIYLSAVSAAFLLVLALRRPAVLFRKPDILNALFWVLFSVGFFPFLVRDAGAGDSPLNCVLLCTVLICAPLLRVKNLWFVFSASVAVNLAAALFAAGSAAVPLLYYVELIAINVIAFFMARNLHGRYFSLLDDQQRLYSQQLSDKLAQEAMQSKLEQDRLVNATRSAFLSRMSHDLRTPLNAVIGLSGIAMDETLPREELSACLSDINVSAKHLLSLINDVLDMSKLESNRMTLHPEPCGTDDFLETIHSVIGVQCEQKHIRFRASCDDGFPDCLLIDKLRFNQILLNLLSNALKFTPAGGEISLRLSHEPREDGTIGLTAVVQDSGRGMEREFTAHAFDAFAQENAEDSECGTGLGLTIVKSIVALMGGDIRIESRVGQGTRVTVTLPVSPAEPSAAVRGTSPEGEGTLCGRRVLVCEDNPINQKVVQCLLEKAGMLVEIAANGQSGVAMFSQSPLWYYSAVMMDVRMPVMDGIAAAAAIRALPRGDAEAVPVIAVTANAYAEDAEMSKAAGMNAHLSKPIDPGTLYKTLERFLAGAARSAAGGDAPAAEE